MHDDLKPIRRSLIDAAAALDDCVADQLIAHGWRMYNPQVGHDPEGGPETVKAMWRRSAAVYPDARMTGTATVQARLAALAEGDRERADALLAEDVVLRIPAKSSLAGVYEGRDEVARALAALDGLTSPGEMVEHTRFSSQERVMLFYEHRIGGAVARSAVIHRASDGLIAEIDVLSCYVDDVATAPLRR